MATAFDTLKYVETLKTAGVDENQAKAQAQALAEAFKEGIGTLATREDMSNDRNLLQAEIARVRTELQAEIARVRTELQAEIAEVKSDVKLLRWMAGFNLALTVAVLWLLIRAGI